MGDPIEQFASGEMGPAELSRLLGESDELTRRLQAVLAGKYPRGVSDERSLDLLVPGFKPKVEGLLGALMREGFHLRPFFTLRDPWTQARLWRQSRGIQEVNRAAEMLARERAYFLRQALVEVGPQHGRWATNALPGQSWHQWGEAVDCFVLEGSRAKWSRSHPGYKRYAELAEGMGLTAGYFWPGSKQDAVHVQVRTSSVRSLYTWAKIDEEMRNRFAG